jgi:hypothetical protein
LFWNKRGEEDLLERLCEKVQSPCPFVLSVSKDERPWVGGSTGSPRTGTFCHIL